MTVFPRFSRYLIYFAIIARYIRMTPKILYCGIVTVVREGHAANTNLMARCQIPHVSMVNPVVYCTVAYGAVALNLSTR